MLNKNNKKKGVCSPASKNKCLTALICLVYFNIQTANIIQKMHVYYSTVVFCKLISEWQTVHFEGLFNNVVKL